MKFVTRATAPGSLGQPHNHGFTVTSIDAAVYKVEKYMGTDTFR